MYLITISQLFLYKESQLENHKQKKKWNEIKSRHMKKRHYILRLDIEEEISYCLGYYGG